MLKHSDFGGRSLSNVEAFGGITFSSKFCNAPRSFLVWYEFHRVEIRKDLCDFIIYFER